MWRFGLGVQFPLPDLEGCRMGHDCPELTQANPLAERYGGGDHVMDPGEEVPMHATFGFENANNRNERLAEWGTFSASYLSLVHPKTLARRTG